MKIILHAHSQIGISDKVRSTVIPAPWWRRAWKHLMRGLTHLNRLAGLVVRWKAIWELIERCFQREERSPRPSLHRCTDRTPNGTAA